MSCWPLTTNRWQIYIFFLYEELSLCFRNENPSLLKSHTHPTSFSHVLGGLSTSWRCPCLHHMGEQLFKISLTKSRTTGVELTRVVDCLYEDFLSDRKRRAAVWQELVHSVRLTFSVLIEMAVVGGWKMHRCHLAAVTFPDSWLHKPFWTQTQTILT